MVNNLNEVKKLDVKQDHLFISYATEDWHLAEWLALKLTAEGYNVWCDRFKLLGGESYPRDIDKAIKEKTFRVLALLSKNSLKKENPLKERTLALNLSRERKEDFLIPINVDGLKATEIDWMQSDLTYILFNKNWAEGLSQLLKKLEKINTPRLSKEDGMNLASKIFLNESNKDIKKGEEVVHTNLVKIEKLPTKIKKITTNTYLEWKNVRDLIGEWVAYFIDPFTLVSFDLPNKEISEELGITKVTDIEWKNIDNIEDVNRDNILKYLISRSLESKCLKLGLLRAEGTNMIYFPEGLLKNDKIKFVNYKGRKTNVMATGVRNIKYVGREYRYHLSPNFTAIIEDNDLLVQVGIQLYITNLSGFPFKSRTAIRKRKRICRDWWNREWLSRHLAIIGFLLDKSGKIVLGNGDSEIILDNNFLAFNTDIKLIESTKSLEIDKKARDELINLEEGEDDE